MIWFTSAMNNNFKTIKWHKKHGTLWAKAIFSTLHLASNLSLAAILWESFTKQSCTNMAFSICKTILRAWQFENDEITKPGPRKRWDQRASQTYIIPLESQIGRRDSVIFTSKESKQMNYRRCLQLCSIHSSILHSPWQRQEKRKYWLSNACIQELWRSARRVKQSQSYLYKLGSGQGWERGKTRWDTRKGKCWLGLSWSVNSLDTFSFINGPELLHGTCSHCVWMTTSQY